MFAVLRFEKQKSWASIGGSGAHNARARETPNADPSLTQKNRWLIGSASDDLVAVVKEKIGAQKIRKNAVLAVDVLLTASHEFFKGEADIDAFTEASMKWLRKLFGDRLVSAVLHLDERTPHIHATFVPLDERGKLNCRAIPGGTRDTLREAQSSYAKAVEHLGLRRGLESSRASHTEVKNFYSYIQRALRSPPDPKAVAVAAVDVARKDEIIEEQRRAISKLEAERSALKRQADMFRDLPLDEVLTRVYGAVEAKDSRSQWKTRKFEFGDLKIAFTNGKWIDNRSGNGGKGAINLVMHLESCDFKGAIKVLSEHFSDGALVSAIGNRSVAEASENIEKIKVSTPVPSPAPVPAAWPAVRRYLTEVRKIPASIVDHAHSLGLVYADERRNAVFKRIKGGCFKRGTSGQDFKQTLGSADCGPFKLPAPATAAETTAMAVVEGPVDALAFRAYFPDLPVIATGGTLISAAAVAAMVKARGVSRVILAHDSDSAGDAQARAIEAALAGSEIKVERRWPTGKDWAASLTSEDRSSKPPFRPSERLLKGR